MARKKKEKPTIEELHARGVNNAYVAERLHKHIDSENPKISLEACNKYLRLNREIADDKGNTTLITNGQTMVIIGATKDRIRALREGPNAEVQPKYLENGAN